MLTRANSRSKGPGEAQGRGPIQRSVEVRPKKVLFFFSLGFDVPSPSLHLMEAMVEDSLRAGLDVHIVATHTDGVYPDIPERLRQHPRLTWDIVKQSRVPKAAFARRYLSGIQYALRCVPLLHNRAGCDVVYVQSSPTALYNILAVKATSKRTSVIYSVQDMFPGSSIHSGVMTKPWMQRVFFRLQKVAYARADHITVISEDMKQRVIEQGVSSEKIHVIVNWYDEGVVHEVPWEENRFVRNYGLSRDTFYVQYAGTLGYVFDYSMVLKVADLLKAHPDIELQMIGDGSQRLDFEQDARKSGLGNIRFYPLQPQEMVGDVYSASSVCLIPLKRGIIGNSVPSKVALIMACNRTMVNSVDEDSAYYRMFPENRIGISAPNTDHQKVADAILKLRGDQLLREDLARNALAFGKSFYARSANTAKLVQLLTEVARGGSV